MLHLSVDKNLGDLWKLWQEILLRVNPIPRLHTYSNTYMHVQTFYASWKAHWLLEGQQPWEFHQGSWIEEYIHPKKRWRLKHHHHHYGLSQYKYLACFPNPLLCSKPEQNEVKLKIIKKNLKVEDKAIERNRANLYRSISQSTCDAFTFQSPCAGCNWDTTWPPQLWFDNLRVHRPWS